MTLHIFGHQSHFSAKQSIIPPKDLVEQANKHSIEALSISDFNSIHALADFTKACDAKSIKPIIGITYDVVDDLKWRKPAKNEKKTKNGFWRPSLYAKNDEGFVDILKLLSTANDEEHFYEHPKICIEDLISTVKRGNVICTTGSIYGLFSHKKHQTIIEKMLDDELRELIRVELCPISQIHFERHNELALKSASKYELKCIISRPSMFDKGQVELRNTINAVLDNSQVDSKWRKEVNSSLSVLSQEEMNESIKSMIYSLKSSIDPETISSTVKAAIVETRSLVNEFNFQWKKMDPCLPKMSETPYETLKDLCIEGFRTRLTRPELGYVPKKEELEKYRSRLQYELTVIKNMGFSDYFLLVHYLVNWCKQEKIVVGPGRGSVGGSLIAFLIGITEVDPIRFDLIFERFINPDRLDLPDIDLDFMSSRRMEILHHLSEKFGKDRVAGISNYAILGASSSLRAIAKANGLYESEYSCSKLIPQNTSLEDNLNQIAELEAFALNHTDIWKKSCQAQGVFRNFGKHAAGIVVAGEPITNRAVLERRSGELIINWDKRVVEDFGLIKLDVLGLTTLDVIALANQYYEEQFGKTIDFNSISLDDEQVLDAFGAGDTVGVFQFESSGMQALLRSLSEEERLTFDDITAATALYRPGPIDSGLMDTFVNIKQGNEAPFYLHENMRPALEPTYSVIVYQEQVMQIARDLAGFSMAESDHLRKAMGKKDPEMMAKYRDKWVSGCESHSEMSKDSANRLFDQIEKFAGYAFNKSHSVEYTIISYWAMWLKVKYPEIFYASTLSVLDSLVLVKDAQKKGVYVVPPEINKSSKRFEIGFDQQRDQKILYAPFQMIKGLSVKGAESIMEAKEKIGRPFVSKDEFISNVYRRAVNVRVQNDLDKVGVFAEVENQIPARHPDRLKDQKQLMPTIITDSVKADRKIEISSYVKSELAEMVQNIRNCDRCTLAGECHPTPRLGKNPKIMIVTDCPNWSEREANRMGEGKASAFLREAIQHVGLTLSDVYITSLVKSPKPQDGQIENEMINGCSDYLTKEIDLLKPPVIFALGGKAARHICPEIKGKWEDVCGEEIYLPNIDSTLLVGFNPMMISFDDSKQSLLNDLFRQCLDLII